MPNFIDGILAGYTQYDALIKYLKDRYKDSRIYPWIPDNIVEAAANYSVMWKGERPGNIPCCLR
jgi:hypothetical protein